MFELCMRQQGHRAFFLSLLLSLEYLRSLSFHTIFRITWIKMVLRQSGQFVFQSICIQNWFGWLRSNSVRGMWICSSSSCTWWRVHKRWRRRKHRWRWLCPSIMEARWGGGICPWWQGSCGGWGWETHSSCQTVSCPWLREKELYRSHCDIFNENLGCSWIVWEQGWVIPRSVKVARCKGLQGRWRRWICHLSSANFFLPDNFVSVFSYFSSCHRFLLLLLTSWRKEQLVDKLKSRQENLTRKASVQNQDNRVQFKVYDHLHPTIASKYNCFVYLPHEPPGSSDRSYHHEETSKNGKHSHL